MKNGIITLLLLACLFMLSRILGVFDYGTFLDKDTYNAQSQNRSRDVNSRAEWHIGVISIPSDPIASEMLDGIRAVTAQINQNGGVSGKQINLIVKEIKHNNPAAHKTAIQELCDMRHIAMIIGGLNTEDIPALRCLTQFQAMPLVSPIALFPDDLPPLYPDISMTCYPNLPHWTNALLVRLRQDNHRKIVIVSPEDSSYGGIFGVETARLLHASDSFDSVYTINYMPPANSAALYRSLKVMTENRKIDAVVFTSTVNDLNELEQALDQLNIGAPVYGTDYLNIDGLDEILRIGDRPLFYPVVNNPVIAGEEYRKHWITKTGSPPSIWNQLGAQTLLLFKQAIEQADNHYTPSTLIQIMDQRLQREQTSEQYQLPIEIIEFQSQTAR